MMSKYKFRQYFNAFVEVIVEADDEETARIIGHDQIADMYQVDDCGYDEDFIDQILNNVSYNNRDYLEMIEDDEDE